MKNILLLPMLFVLFFVSTNIQAQNLILMGSEASCENGRVFKIVYNEPTGMAFHNVNIITQRKSSTGNFWNSGIFGTPSNIFIPPNTTEKTFEYCTMPAQTI